MEINKSYCVLGCTQDESVAFLIICDSVYCMQMHIDELC